MRVARIQVGTILDKSVRITLLEDFVVTPVAVLRTVSQTLEQRYELCLIIPGLCPVSSLLLAVLHPVVLASDLWFQLVEGHCTLSTLQILIQQ